MATYLHVDNNYMLAHELLGELAAAGWRVVENRVFRWFLDGVGFVALHRNRYWKTGDDLQADIGGSRALG